MATQTQISGILSLAFAMRGRVVTPDDGLTVDNLLEADVVLVNGERGTANHADHSDLFWALRGAGGNFGIVTSFLFRTHPVDTVYGCPIILRPNRIAAA